MPRWHLLQGMLMLGNLPVVSYDLTHALRSAGVRVRVSRTFLTIFFLEVLMMCGVLMASTLLLYGVSCEVLLDTSGNKYVLCINPIIDLQDGAHSFQVYSSDLSNFEHVQLQLLGGFVVRCFVIHGVHTGMIPGFLDLGVSSSMVMPSCTTIMRNCL